MDKQIHGGLYYPCKITGIPFKRTNKQHLCSFLFKRSHTGVKYFLFVFGDHFDSCSYFTLTIGQGYRKKRGPERVKVSSEA